MNPIFSDNQILLEGQLKKSMADFSGLVIRGNPRIIACNSSVELPLSSSPCPVSDTAKAAKPEQNPAIT